ncbi:MAG TPA: hypothetical protein VGK13_01850 [Methanocellaceae archaeon]
MAHIDRYMYVGEKALFSMKGGSILGSEELAATDRRVIYVKGDQFYDLKYESLVSLGCYTIYEWKWVLIAIIATVTALLMTVTIFIPLKFSTASIESLINMMSFSIGILLAFSGAMILAFFITIRRGIIMKTQSETRCFSFYRSQMRDAHDFVKIVRAAEAGIVKPHKNIMPEIIEPKTRSLDAIKPARASPNDRMPKL